jgi:hypothetical protein
VGEHPAHSTSGIREADRAMIANARILGASNWVDRRNITP